MDHSRIGITGYVSGIGKPRDVANIGVGLQDGAEVAGSLGAYGPSVALGGAGIAADGIASAQKGGEATLDERVRMSTEIANIWGVEIDSTSMRAVRTTRRSSSASRTSLVLWDALRRAREPGVRRA